MFDKRWVVRPENIITGAADRRSAGAADADAVEEILLRNRGIGRDGVNAFFAPASLPPVPEDPSVDAAVDIILSAADSGTRITVFGDYDCDGICATAVMYHFLKESAGADVEYYLPDRFAEGYGISPEAVERLCEQGTGLIITVDNGISALPAAARAAELGVAMVITDHHLPGAELPECGAVVDPHLDSSAFAFRDECGAGVAFTLVRAMAEAIGIEDAEIRGYLPAVAIATIGDSVPLTGTNRVYVKRGLMAAESLLRGGADGGAGDGPFGKGIRAMLNACGISGKERIPASDISFRLVPKINAAGRMGSAGRALELLLTDTDREAEAAAVTLIEENKNRQAVEHEIFVESDSPGHLMTSENDGVVLSLGEEWHQGVLGIVASRLAEKYGKPAIVLALADDSDPDDPLLKGSGRSVRGVDIHKMLSACAPFLDGFGGHPMAAGIAIRRSNIGRFIDAVNGYFASAGPSAPRPAPEAVADAVVDASLVNTELADTAAAFEPCGVANPQPLFIVTGLKLGGVRRIGADGAHLRMSFSFSGPGGSGTIDGVAFRCGNQFETISHMKNVSVLCTLERDRMRADQVSLLIQDVHEFDLSIENTAACMYNKPYITFGSFTVEKGFLRVIYRCLSAFPDEFDFNRLIAMKSELTSNGIECSWYRLRTAVGIFTGLGLLSRISGLVFRLNRSVTKTDIDGSPLYTALRTES